MGLPRFLLHQLSCPSGWFAPITAKLLNHSNRSFNREVMSTVALQPHEHVLEIGFGSGLNLAHALEIVGELGRVGGIEPSSEMLEQARKRHHEDISNGVLALREGRADALPFANASYDAVLSVHTVYFWGGPGPGLTEIMRVLKPEGRLCLGLEDPKECERLGLDRLFRMYTQEEIVELLQQAGFVAVKVRRARSQRTCYHVSAQKPSG